MKYKAADKKFIFIPENFKDAYFLGTVFNELSKNLYAINFVNSELNSVSIKFEDILSMIGNDINE